MQLFQTIIFTILTFLSSFIPQKPFVEGIVGQPKSLNPLKVSTNKVDQSISPLVFRGLTKYDREGNLVGDLAKSWEISEDGLTYTFYLRNDVFWHDGKKFRADDVIFTASSVPFLSDLIIDKIDDYAVRFTLPNPFSPFLDILTLGIAPQHKGKEMSNFYLVGTGPYKIVRVKKSGPLVSEIALLSANPNFKIKKIVFRFYENEEDLLTAVKLGEIDALAVEKKIPSWPNLNFYKTSIKGRYYALFFNLQKEVLNKELRSDLASFTPKDKIIKKALLGEGEITKGPLDQIFPISEGQKETFEKNYNLSLTLTFPKKDTHLKTAQILKEEWKKIGINLNLKMVEPSDLEKKIIKTHDFEILLLGQEVSLDPDRYSLWHSTQKDYPGLNFTSLESARIDKALEGGRREKEWEERKEHYQIFQDAWILELPAIFLYHPHLTYGVTKGIKGVDLKGFFLPPDRFLNLRDWKWE